MAARMTPAERAGDIALPATGTHARGTADLFGLYPLGLGEQAVRAGQDHDTDCDGADGDEEGNADVGRDH